VQKLGVGKSYQIAEIKNKANNKTKKMNYNWNTL